MSEKELIKLAKSGDPSAQEKLLKQNKGLVINIVNNYYFYDGQKDELIQEGTIGLFEAIANYNLNSNAKLSTYAYQYIKNKVLKSLNITSTNKHIPDNIINKYVKIKREMNKFYSENGYEASYEDLEVLLGKGFSKDKIFTIIKTFEEAHSIDDEEGTILENQSETEQIIVDYGVDDIEKYYSILKPIEKQIIELRSKNYKYKDIKPVVNLTENKIRRIECSAIVKIKKQIKKERK